MGAVVGVVKGANLFVLVHLWLKLAGPAQPVWLVYAGMIIQQHLEFVVILMHALTRMMYYCVCVCACVRMCVCV